MKNIYMLQTNINYPNGTYLPYAAGSIAAYALTDPVIAGEYALKEIFCFRGAPADIVSALASPAVFSFSCYVWNTEFNKEVARLVKQAYPDCVTVFGGHNIPDSSPAFLEQNPFADVLIFGEGERPFRAVLSAIAGKTEWSRIPGIAWRQNGTAVVNAPAEPEDLSGYPSPYAMGLFDPILEKYPDTDFSAILETNRGCPYHCAFCDWCEQEAKIRSFSWERIEADIRWMAEKKIEFCYCADANFGIRKRDEALIDYLIENKKRCGYPQKFRVNYAKLNNDTVFRITQKLEAAGLNRGATISFQSMTPETLKSIGRENMPVSQFTRLMERYRAAGISTYTEVILGLPGETYDDFCRGIGKLLEAGQHTTLFIYNCELIVNSAMADPAYLKKYGIRSVRTPLYLRHNAAQNDGIEEHSRCVICTDKMDTDDWIRANMFSVLIQSCHSMGLLRFFALYLYDVRGVPYETFYRELQTCAETDGASLLGQVYAEIRARFADIAAGCGEWSCRIPGTGPVSWPYEEAFYIRLLLQADRFYAETVKHLTDVYRLDADISADLAAYQRMIVKEPGKTTARAALTYDLAPYFDELMRCGSPALKKRRNSVIAYAADVPADRERFMRETVWFGRAAQKNLFSDLSVRYGDGT